MIQELERHEKEMFNMGLKKVVYVEGDDGCNGWTGMDRYGR